MYTNHWLGGYSASTCMLLSPKLWILGIMSSLDPGVSEVRETGYLELGPAQIFFHLIWGLLSLGSFEAETGGKAKLDGLGGVLTSRRDMGLPISTDDGSKLQL